MPVQTDRLADGRDLPEQLSAHLAADEGHAPLQPHVLGVDEAAAASPARRAFARRLARRREPADPICFVPHSDRCVLHELRAPGLDERQVAHRHGVVQAHPDPVAGPLAAGLHAGLARPEDRRRRRRTRPGSRPQQRLVEAVAVGQQHRRPTRCPRRCRASTGPPGDRLRNRPSIASRTISPSTRATKRSPRLAAVACRPASGGAARAGYVRAISYIS